MGAVVEKGRMTLRTMDEAVEGVGSLGGIVGGCNSNPWINWRFRGSRADFGDDVLSLEVFQRGGMRRYQFRVSTQILSFSHPTLNFCTAGQRLVYSANDCDDTVKHTPEGIYQVFSIESRQKPQSWSEN